MGKNWKKPLTEAQISEACALRNLGRGWAAIARAVGATEYTLIKHLDARRLRLKREYDYKYHLEHRTSEGGTKTDSRPNIPPHVLENRDRRMNQERSLSAVVFGDPPYEQSALGKRNGETGQETESWKKIQIWRHREADKQSITGAGQITAIRYGLEHAAQNSRDNLARQAQADSE